MKFNFTNVREWNPLSGGAPEEGAYKGTIVEVDPKYHDGKSTDFTVDLTEGPSAGMQTHLYVGNDPGPKGGNTKKWKTLLKSVATARGKSDEEAEKMFGGDVEFDPMTLKGNPCYVMVRENPDTYKDPQTGVEKKSGPDRDFMTKSQFESYSKAAPKSAGKPAAPATPATSAGGTNALENLFKN